MSSRTAIPKVFHFVFGLKEQTEPFHLMYYLCLRSCIEVNCVDSVNFHYQHEPHGEWWDRIKPSLCLRRIDPDQFVSTYDYEDHDVAAFRYAHLADFARLKILEQEGGIYADIDTLFVRPFPDEWLSAEFILGRERPPREAKGGGSLCNAWIASRPGAEFGRLWYASMNDAFDGSWSNHSTLLPYRLSEAFPQLLRIEPESSFYALDWTSRGINDLFRQRAPLPANAYSLHLWSHLWFDERRLDFSHFHGGLLTVDYVAFAESTYAILARRFLPPYAKPSRLRYLEQRAAALLIDSKVAIRRMLPL